MVLAGLRDIEWGKLTHAYGSAADVPDLLEQLMSRNIDVIDHLRWVLHGNVVHQGSIYEATAFVVPFLIELLAHPAPITEAKSVILSLLRISAKGYASLLENHSVAFPSDTWNEDPEEQHTLTAHEAVREGIPLYTHLLTDPHEEIADEAGEVLAEFPEEYEDIATALQHAILQTSSLRNRINFMVCLESLSEDIQIPDPEFRQQFSSFMSGFLSADYHPMLRLGAARCLVQWLRGDTPRAALELLLTAYIDSDTWDSMNNIERVYARIHMLPEVMRLAGGRWGLPLLRRLLPQVAEIEKVHQLAILLLDWLFEEAISKHFNCIEKRADFIGYRWHYDFRDVIFELRSELTYAHYAYLTTLVNHHAFWQIETNLLAFYGLPSDRNELFYFLKRMNPLKTNL